MSLSTLTCLLLVFVLTGTNAASLTYAKNLSIALSTGYNKELRPVDDQNSNVSITIDMYLISIKDFDEVSGTLNVVAVLIINWYDESLIWDPAAYDWMHNINIGQNNIWLPKLYNLKVSNSFTAVSDSDLKVRIHNDGLITWQPGGLIDVKCNPDVSYFPFDTQTCSIQFATWGYSQSEVWLKPFKKELTLDFYETNGEWSLDKTSTGTSELSDISLAIFNITISRLPAFHIVNTLMPIFLLMFINPLVFLLPCDSGERVGFSLTVFLTFTVFITIINSVLPANSESMSRISYFIFVVLVASGVIASINIFQLRMYHREESLEVPRWLVRFVRILNCQFKSGKNNVNSFCPEDANSNSVTDHERIGQSVTKEHPPVDNIQEMTWKDVVRITDNFYMLVFYVTISVSSIAILVSMSQGNK
ncbi:acetylcholine receptor subunit alpha-1-B-like [Mizuhopecten yessoensis]|uniref:Acetylcholine receptor subunit alpha-1-B n=1 Tax=Mizuhopecten yessoensis TaxID=6573 RepID=A0A210QNP0_MIZYE|nr:acetylcholine receptor subunit alpha-1-B-like [Mizuhopecten yessoensis]OWF50353.1 Acetylcholine receptor subunit alpha-1-B [Mizuhopecten yessoensis]